MTLSKKQMRALKAMYSLKIGSKCDGQGDMAIIEENILLCFPFTTLLGNHTDITTICMKYIFCQNENAGGDGNNRMKHLDTFLPL